MRGQRLTPEEVARRRAALNEFYESGGMPPLYRTSEMDPAMLRRGTVRDAELQSQRISVPSPDGRARHEVYTLERGAADDLARVLWMRRFTGAMPDPSGVAVAVTLLNEVRAGELLWRHGDDWAVSVSTSTHELLVVGDTAMPTALVLERVDPQDAE